MLTLCRDLRDFFVSLKLTVALIALSILLVLLATLDQVHLGVWAIQAKWFYSWIVWSPVGEFNIPIYFGGYTIGGFLLVNLLAAHIYRFQFTWRKLGIHLAHAGLILLIVGQLCTGLLQDEYQMRIDQGATSNFSESYRNVELAVTDTTDPQFDEVVAIPESPLARRQTVQHPKLPFRVTVKTWLPNSALRMRASTDGDSVEPIDGLGARIVATISPLTYKQDERNLPSALVQLDGPDGKIGTYLVSVHLLESQWFRYANHQYKLALRFARHYQPFSLTLLKFSHDTYAGTDIPKNFSSRVRLRTPDGSGDREVLIYMNSPLRYGGLTFYQSGFENNDRTTVLQVVRNPSWLVPYIACVVMTLGLLFQFGLHLVGFATRRTAATKASAAA